jgi:hypothetical protein
MAVHGANFLQGHCANASVAPSQAIIIMLEKCHCWHNFLQQHVVHRAPEMGVVLFHSCSACWYWRRPMISLDTKWSGHPGPRPTHSSLRPLQVECSGEHGSPVRGALQMAGTFAVKPAT